MHQNAEATQQDLAAEESRIVILDALGLSLASKRRDAIAGRAASGIEEEWTGDEEFYQGYDDANRHEFVNTTAKPEAGSSSVARKSAGSIVFPNITQPYVDAVAARVGDMLLPTDDRNYALDATPIPDMAEGLGESLRQMNGTEDAIAAAIEQVRAEFNKLKAEAARKADKAETRIDDWLTECQYHGELRKMIDEAAKLGSGVIKGPVPVKRKRKAWQKNEEGTAALVVVEEIKPATFRVDPWNFYPDPACGESIHNGSYTFERDFMTEKKLSDLRGLPGYINSQIDRCIEEGPGNRKETDARNRSTKDQYEIWYAYITIKDEELQAAGCDCGEAAGYDRKSFPAILTMVNDHVLRASLNPMDSGDFPYDVIPWKRRPGMPWGTGIARQLRTPQRIVVGATRRLMDNAGLASGPQLVVRRSVKPENGIWEIVPLKLWIEDDESSGQASSPVTSVVIPMLQVELTNIIQLGMKMAEDVTGMPMLMQGQQGKAPDTVGGMTILNNNANAVLRRIARLFDSCITEPHIRRYYAWLMEYGEDDDEKGDFQIVARGSTALVERDIQSQEMPQILGLCLNPAFGIDPKKTMAEYLKSRRFDPAAFEYTEEEQKNLASQPQPEDPRITAAKIMAESKKEALGAEAQKVQMQLQSNQQENALNRALAQRDKEIDAQLASAELSSEERIALEKQKVLLASVSLRLQVQERMSGAGIEHQKDIAMGGHRMALHNSQQAIAPAAEPAGRAENGMAFQQ